MQYILANVNVRYALKITLFIKLRNLHLNTTMLAK